MLSVEDPLKERLSDRDPTCSVNLQQGSDQDLSIRHVLRDVQKRSELKLAANVGRCCLQEG